MNYWAMNWVINGFDDICHEYGSYAISFWNRSQPDSCLSLALLAFAHAVFGRARQVHQVIEHARKLFTRTIVKVDAEIRHVADETIDELIIAIMLMGSFEVSCFLN